MRVIRGVAVMALGTIMFLGSLWLLAAKPDYVIENTIGPGRPFIAVVVTFMAGGIVGAIGLQVLTMRRSELDHFYADVNDRSSDRSEAQFGQLAVAADGSPLPPWLHSHPGRQAAPAAEPQDR